MSTHDKVDRNYLAAQFESWAVNDLVKVLVTPAEARAVAEALRATPSADLPPVTPNCPHGISYGPCKLCERDAVAAASPDLPQLLGSLIEAVTDACDSTNSGDQMQAAMRKADGIRLDIEQRFALSATSAHISLDDIRQQIDHIEQNGIDLAKYGGTDADEGRCRELCAMYLREMILAHGMQQRLDELDRSEGRDA